MENRFGVKDFFLFAMMAVVIVMIAIFMWQSDRQWAVLQQQRTDLSELRKMVAQGVPAAGNRTAANTPMAGFERVQAARSMPGYAVGDTVVGTLIGPPKKLTPLIGGDAASTRVLSYVQEGLCGQDPDTLAFTPSLAESWTVSDDQLTMDFKLRQNVTFSDGEPFTADDVVYTMNLIMNQDIEDEPLRGYLQTFDHVEKTGPYAARFKFKRPYFKSFEEIAGIGMMSHKFYERFNAKAFNESTGWVMGTGPYRLADPTKEWKPAPGAPVELVRNARYWGIPPAVDKLVWKVIQSAAVRQTAFRNGETDQLNYPMSMPTPEQYDQMLTDPALLKRTQHFDLQIPNIGYIYIGWNQKIDGKPTPFADARVRRAMTMLLDREAICRDVLHGYAAVNSGPFSSLTAQADPSIKPWPFDPDAAKKLLADAGYHLADGSLVGPDGAPLRFKLSYNTGNPIREQIASMAKDAYARAGIVADITPTEFSVILDQIKEHELQSYIMGWTGQVEGDPYQIFATASSGPSGSNTVSYSNPKLDEAIDKGRAIKDEAARMAVWHEVHRIIHEDQPYTFLYISHDLEFLDARFKNVTPTKTGISSLGEWYVPTGSQKYTQ